MYKNWSSNFFTWTQWTFLKGKSKFQYFLHTLTRKESTDCEGTVIVPPKKQLSTVTWHSWECSIVSFLFVTILQELTNVVAYTLSDIQKSWRHLSLQSNSQHTHASLTCHYIQYQLLRPYIWRHFCTVCSIISSVWYIKLIKAIQYAGPVVTKFQPGSKD